MGLRGGLPPTTGSFTFGDLRPGWGTGWGERGVVRGGEEGSGEERVGRGIGDSDPEEDGTGRERGEG